MIGIGEVNKHEKKYNVNNGSDNETGKCEDSDSRDYDEDGETNNRDRRVNDENMIVEDVSEESTTDMIELSGSFYKCC